MKKLTEQQIEKLIKPANKNTGVKAITRDMLEGIDLDLVPTFVRNGKSWTGDFGVLMSNGVFYARERFTPRAGSYAFKPSFAGSQVLIGIGESGDPIFSNGVWFSSIEEKKEV